MQFKNLNLIAPLLAAVEKAGYETPSPIQKKTIPLVLAGRDVLGCAQTGTGKTAAFALPMLQRLHKSNRPKGRPVRALILTPTRELAIQIFENFTQYGEALPLKTAVIFGGVNQNPQVETLKRGVDILVATPGRLNDLIGQGHVSLEKLEIFVLDEADRMLDMGFIHDVKKVIKLLPDKRQTLLFSATMPKEVEELALGLLRDPATVKISPVTKTVDAIAQSVWFVEKGNKVALLQWLMEQHKMEAVLVFTRTKHGANQLATKLTKAGVQALAIHGNKSQNARQEALGRFKAGKLRALVATDIAARGIDVAELPFVVNFNVPDTPEAYIHRIGRTGRAGASGRAFTFCCSEELKDWRDIEKHTKQSPPVGEHPWAVTDMQPIDPPPPGANRQKAAQQKPKEAPKSKQDTPKAKPKPEPAKKPKEQPKPDKPKATPKPERPKEERPVSKPERPKKAKPAPKVEPQPKAKTEPKKPEPADEPVYTPRTSSYGSAYSSRYGTARPVRPFQSRTSFAPKAEDLPPPEAKPVRIRDWSADEILPERRRITGDWDVEEPQEAPPAPVEKEGAPAPKKRRHRGGRKHRKPQNKSNG